MGHQIGYYDAVLAGKYMVGAALDQVVGKDVKEVRACVQTVGFDIFIRGRGEGGFISADYRDRIFNLGHFFCQGVGLGCGGGVGGPDIGALYPIFHHLVQAGMIYMKFIHLQLVGHP